MGIHNDKALTFTVEITTQLLDVDFMKRSQQSQTLFLKPILGGRQGCKCYMKHERFSSLGVFLIAHQGILFFIQHINLIFLLLPQ